MLNDRRVYDGVSVSRALQHHAMRGLFREVPKVTKCDPFARTWMSGRFAIIAALGAAVLFGASTPFAKTLVGDVPPMLLAGFLYWEAEPVSG